MADVIDFPGSTSGDVNVEDVLDGGKHLAVVVVMGYTEDGEEYFASSTGDVPLCFYLASRYANFLLGMSDEPPTYQ